MTTLTERQTKALRWVLIEVLEVSLSRLHGLPDEDALDEVDDLKALAELIPESKTVADLLGDAEAACLELRN